MDLNDLKPIVALAKRRGFVFPGSDIYGGFANTYSYGPYGVELKKRVKDLWWDHFVRSRDDMLGLDGPILMHPRVWEASGHTESFSDALVDCKSCKGRLRADHVLEKVLKRDVEGLSLEQMTALFQEHKIACPHCGKRDFTDVRQFNLMFSTQLSKTGGDAMAYLRPETAQAMFVDFKNVVDSCRVKVPFGLAQIGKAFRNEITPGNFIFRVIEFEQMEIEYFIHPSAWETIFEEWLAAMQQWCQRIGLKKAHIALAEHPKEKLSHYSKRTVDITYAFPFGQSELYGLAYRTDYDLKRHSEFSGKKLEYTDPKTNERYTPHVIEPTFGVDRTVLALLCDAYDEEKLDNGEMRTVLRFEKELAPYRCAVFPLMKKDELGALADKIYRRLQKKCLCDFDDSGNIGKRYRRHDELGTPYCITVDYDSLEDKCVTIRERDSMKQSRVAIDAIEEIILSSE